MANKQTSVPGASARRLDCDVVGIGTYVRVVVPTVHSRLYGASATVTGRDAGGGVHITTEPQPERCVDGETHMLPTRLRLFMTEFKIIDCHNDGHVARPAPGVVHDALVIPRG